MQLVYAQIGGKWALDLQFTLLLIPFSMRILPFLLGCGSVIEAKRKSTLSAAFQVPFLTTWVRLQMEPWSLA